MERWLYVAACPLCIHSNLITDWASLSLSATLSVVWIQFEDFFPVVRFKMTALQETWWYYWFWVISCMYIQVVPAWLSQSDLCTCAHRVSPMWRGWLWAILTMEWITMALLKLGRSKQLRWALTGLSSDVSCMQEGVEEASIQYDRYN